MKAPIIRLAKNMAIGGTAGFVTGRLVSDSLGADKAAHKGLKYGATVGAIASLPGGKIAKASGEALKAMHKGVKAQGGYGVVFRRIRGRIVPVRIKG